ncbi:MAG: hypothetical protein AAF439_12510 [Pseudomonadota bacterium]
MATLLIGPAPGDLFTGAVVTDGHFGANYLFNRESFNEQIGDGAFDETIETLGVSHVRYPGGTIAETQFDLSAPDNTLQTTNLITGAAISNTAQHRLTPLSEFMAAAVGGGLKVTIVLPTARYLDDILAGGTARQAIEAEVKAFIATLMTMPGAGQIELLEIGNEYATLGLTPAEYGRIADAMIPWVAEALAAAPCADPAIALQLSPKSARVEETMQILQKLSDPARAAVDAVIIHNYRPTPWDEAATTAGKFDHAAAAEQFLGRELLVAVTEWNVGNASPNDGLLQGAGLLEMFHQHATSGVDLAHVWPILENNSTRLAADVTDPGSAADLIIGGEIFRQMSQSLRGAQLLNIDPYLDVDGDEQTDLLLHAYALQGGGGVLFLSSLQPVEHEISLDLSAISSLVGAGRVWITRTGVAEGTDPTSAEALPVMHAWVEDASATLQIPMAPYEILRLEYEGAGLPVTVSTDADGVQDLRPGSGADIVAFSDDGARDLLRGFQVGIDRIDVSAWGVAEFGDLQIAELRRSDGSVSWVEVRDQAGDAELILRYADGPLSGNRLLADSFIFAPSSAPPLPPIILVDSDGYDDLRGTAAAEVFRMADDGIRDIVRGFEQGLDLIDLTALDAQTFEDLTITNIYRKSGSVNWIEVRDVDNDVEFFLRLANPDEQDASMLTAADFIFG